MCQRVGVKCMRLLLMMMNGWWDGGLAHLKEGVPIEVKQAKREVLLRLLPELGVLFIAAQSERAALRLEIDG